MSNAFDWEGFKSSLIVFGRAIFSAGVAGAIVFTRDNFLTLPSDQLAKGALIAFLTGAILFVGNYLREITTPAATPKPQLRSGKKSKVWADYLPF